MAETVKMTQRIFLNAVLKSEVPADVKEYAEEALAKLDAKNEKRSSKPSKKALENEPIKTAMEAMLQEKPYLASEMAKEYSTMSDEEISTQKASNLLRQLVEEGRATVKDIKVKGKGTQKQYSAVVVDEESIDEE